MLKLLARKQPFTALLVGVGMMLIAISPSQATSRISGTYVNHGSTFVEMLQLTETQNGRINGVFSSVQLKRNGEINSEQVPVSGSVDAEQLTLTAHSFLSFLVGTNIAGTVKGNTIELQNVDSNGNVTSPLFVRSTPEQFKAYAERLKSQGEATVRQLKFEADAAALNRKLLNGAQEFGMMARNADAWIANAELHAGRIPAAKAEYETIEEGMRAMIAQEGTTRDSVARSQISIAVMQADITGGQVDIDLNQIWDINLGYSGSDMDRQFRNWDGNCGTAAQLQRRGATAQASEAWESACQSALAERAKFGLIYKRITDQRAELKSFQSSAESHRKALVEEANRISYSQ